MLVRVHNVKILIDLNFIVTQGVTASGPKYPSINIWKTDNLSSKSSSIFPKPNQSRVQGLRPRIIGKVMVLSLI